MRNIYFIFFLLIIISGCYSYREYPVEYDYSYHGKFKKYKTFTFIENQGNDETMSNAVIQQAIKKRMELQGYRQKSSKPNLLVSYKIYFDSLNFRGYDQLDIEKWIKSQRIDEEYDPRYYNLRKGTLLIQLYDRKQERAIWQGYATGIYGNIYFDNERQLKVAVRSILDRYQFLAQDFLKDKEFVIKEEINN
ncbi:MAG: DUF4136 domain-containing protein [Bacteroidetes bacterium]|nr:DUF4136 domain-containing protein [Bacteroidota bacterium]